MPRTAAELDALTNSPEAVFEQLCRIDTITRVLRGDVTALPMFQERGSIEKSHVKCLGVFRDEVEQALVDVPGMEGFVLILQKGWEPGAAQEAKSRAIDVFTDPSRTEPYTRQAVERSLDAIKNAKYVHAAAAKTWGLITSGDYPNDREYWYGLVADGLSADEEFVNGFVHCMVGGYVELARMAKDFKPDPYAIEVLRIVAARKQTMATDYGRIGAQDLKSLYLRQHVARLKPDELLGTKQRRLTLEQRLDLNVLRAIRALDDDQHDLSPPEGTEAYVAKMCTRLTRAGMGAAAVALVAQIAHPSEAAAAPQSMASITQMAASGALRGALTVEIPDETAPTVADGPLATGEDMTVLISVPRDLRPSRAKTTRLEVEGAQTEVGNDGSVSITIPTAGATRETSGAVREVSVTRQDNGRLSIDSGTRNSNGMEVAVILSEAAESLGLRKNSNDVLVGSAVHDAEIYGVREKATAKEAGFRIGLLEAAAQYPELLGALSESQIEALGAGTGHDKLIRDYTKYLLKTIGNEDTYFKDWTKERRQLYLLLKANADVITASQSELEEIRENIQGTPEARTKFERGAAIQRIERIRAKAPSDYYANGNDSYSAAEIVDMTVAASKRFESNRALLLGQQEVESMFVEHVRNSIGAEGLGQFLPGTWADFAGSYGIPADGSRGDARYMTTAQAAYMARLTNAAEQMIDDYDMKGATPDEVALMSYTWGIGKVKAFASQYHRLPGTKDIGRAYSFQGHTETVSRDAVVYPGNVLERARAFGYIDDENQEAGAKHKLPNGIVLRDALKAKYGKYNSGRLRNSELERLGDRWGGHKLHPAAADAFRDLDAAFYERFGRHIRLTDSYRTRAEQEVLKDEKPRLAATPGRSNHGWGFAIDFSSNINNSRSAEHRWMDRNAHKFGWRNPSWAKGSKQFEPWHWEFYGSGTE